MLRFTCFVPTLWRLNKEEYVGRAQMLLPCAITSEEEETAVVRINCFLPALTLL